MTINGNPATRELRTEAANLWRKVIEDQTINHHITVEYKDQSIKISFDNAAEQISFMRELAAIS